MDLLLLSHGVNYEKSCNAFFGGDCPDELVFLVFSQTMVDGPVPLLMSLHDSLMMDLLLLSWEVNVLTSLSLWYFTDYS